MVRTSKATGPVKVRAHPRKRTRGVKAHLRGRAENPRAGTLDYYDPKAEQARDWFGEAPPPPRKERPAPPPGPDLSRSNDPMADLLKATELSDREVMAARSEPKSKRQVTLGGH